ncbi:MAG TPA: ABC transporter ATP-binding protein [Myxococcota bacterium]|nr:ABC transporter ATP-binding protein [Myxococcota bacterium]
MSAVIEIERLGKRYRIGRERRALHPTLRDSIAQFGRGVWRGFRHPVAQSRARSHAEEFWALRDVDLAIGRGDRLAVIGANGAGKSTLLKILSRVTAPSTGRAVLRGRVACLLEVGTGFHPELTGRENVFLNGAILGMSRREIGARFDEIVAFAGVERFLDTPVKRYSSGMNLRLAFAVAAHLEPEVLIVDEVLAVGDAGFQQKCLGKMGEARDQGRTLIFVSHNMQAVRHVCNRGAILRAGELVFHGPAEDAVDRYLKGEARAESLASLADAIEMLPIDPVFRFEEIDVTQDGESIDLVDNGKPLEIAIAYRVLERTRGLRVYFDCCDMEQTLLFRSFHDGDCDEIPTLAPGAYRSRVVIPENLLGPTSYRLIFRATIYNQRSLTPPGGVSAVINVVQAGRYNRSYVGDTFRGKIAPCLEWKTEQIDA